MGVLFAVGIGVGLASVAGVRAYLPLLFVGLFAALGLFELPNYLGFLDEWPVLLVLLALAVAESVLDKIPALNPVLDYVQTPARIAAGAALFAAAGFVVGATTVAELVVGGVIAGLVAVPKVLLRPPARVAAAGVSARFLSLCEDVIGVAGGLVAVFVPLLPLAFVAFLLLFYYRVRRRRGRKYGGLRILGD